MDNIDIETKVNKKSSIGFSFAIDTDLLYLIGKQLNEEMTSTIGKSLLETLSKTIGDRIALEAIKIAEKEKK